MIRKLNGRAVACLVLMAIAAAAFLQATQWPLSAKLFPMVVSVPLFLLALTEFAFNVFGAGEGKEEKGEDPRVARKHALIIFGWCFAFFAMVILLGFSIAVPLFVFLYVKPYSKERWGISIALTALAGLCFYGLFVRLLNVHFAPGLLEQGLKAMGLL